jgi:hypothetical protein
MTALPAPDRAKLAKLPLPASDKPGEVVAAAAAAHQILDKAGLSWGDILTVKPPEHREPFLGTWRTTCAELRKRPGDRRPWERSFVADLPRFQRLSVKQRYCFKEIADRVLGRHEV